MRMGGMTGAEMWKVCGKAATMLDAPGCDWRTLQEVEGILSSLSTELERATAVTTVRAHHVAAGRRVDADLRLLRTSLTWVREHEYDALETELQGRLDIALECAMGSLGRLETSQREMQTLYLAVVAADDGR